jgi:DNA-binding PucR family transcriptional regulator
VQVGEELPGLEQADDGQPFSLLLVPDVDGPGRLHLLRVLDGRHAVVGPARPWTSARDSFDRAVRTLTLLDARPGPPVDTETHLADLVVSADAAALTDLRNRVLAPLAGLRRTTRERLEETLRSWLLHLGRRDEVAADLHVHAQTVRYRMGQLREVYGDRLDDPETVRELVVALRHPRVAGRGEGTSRGPAPTS